MKGRDARLTVVHDITKTKHAEGELRRTKIFLNAVIEHVPVPIVVRDLTARTRGRGAIALHLVQSGL